MGSFIFRSITASQNIYFQSSKTILIFKENLALNEFQKVRKKCEISGFSKMVFK